jgi:hypothetical protein
MPKPMPATLKIRMSESLRAKLDLAARQRRSSLNGEIVRRLEESVDMSRPDPGKLAKVLMLAVTKLQTVRDDLPDGQYKDDLTNISDNLARAVFYLFGVTIVEKEDCKTVVEFDPDTLLGVAVHAEKGSDR